MHAQNIIERAFELACSSATIDEVRHALRREGYANVDALVMPWCTFTEPEIANISKRIVAAAEKLGGKLRG